MLTAHLPSGYCLAKLSGWRGPVFMAAIVGAVLPDVDLLFFYFVDDRAFHHHRYWVHVPFFWMVVAGLALPILWKTHIRSVAVAFFAAVQMHMVLDSIGGGIMWFAPLNTELLTLVTVEPTHSHWILSFLLHWTFVLELLIWIGAIHLFFKGRRLGGAS